MVVTTQSWIELWNWISSCNFFSFLLLKYPWKFFMLFIHYNFLNNNNLIFNLQFGFRQQYSTSHTLINIRETKRKALDDWNIGWGVFVDLQKAFNTMDQQILLAQWNHYGICGVSNDCFKSYLSSGNQYVTIWSCYKLWRPQRICSRASSIFIIYKWPY